MASYHTLRLILGDQLNHAHPWFQQKDDKVLYLMTEALSETGYVRHHIQKVTGYFLAMRHFAEELQKQGHELRYLRLDDRENQQSIGANLKKIAEEESVERIQYQYPEEYRLEQELKQLSGEMDIPLEPAHSAHFLTGRDEVEKMFAGKKQYLLETFYRRVRARYGVMMEADGETPLTGRWNYDEENRKKLPKKQAIPEHLHFRRDVTDIVELLQRMKVETIGTIDPQNFTWPVTREECLQLLDHFKKHQLPLFGAYQDAMTDRDYLLFHSKLSFTMNTKMLSPLEVVTQCVEHWEKHRDEIQIAQIEGFIRQIIGWREYMRGIYWAKMPEYAEMNFFEHRAKLPDFYWTGQTKMKCVGHAVNQSLEHAYAHHIQRLMVTGNFALLMGVHPDEVDEWYLGIYMDAQEWVEITNTRGMSQFADGGIVGTKPYISSANYIHKMSDYCANCHYDRKKKYGDKACPFNSLYWDFYHRHRDKLGKNPRVAMMYRVLDKMDAEEREAILRQAATYRKNADKL